MRRTILALLTVAVFSPLAAQAQQWNAEQQEVWDAEVACLNAGIDDIPARKACVHPDFMGWGIQQPVPTGFLEKDFDYYFAHNTLKVTRAVPLHILVEDDLAIIQLIVKVTSSLDGGPDEETWVAWTDIMRKDNGVWRWIADHGHILSNDN
jgi:hypothetical protein